METRKNLTYIVFVTYNLNNGCIYIGTHYTDPTEFDFYIGDGIYTNNPETYEI